MDVFTFFTFTVRTQQKLDVFHQRNLRKIIGVSWKDHVPNSEVLKRTGERRLQDIVLLGIEGSVSAK